VSGCFGRDAGSSEFDPIVPVPPIIPSLCAVMGKELACEGFSGTVRVVWCTTLPSDSKVYVSIVGATGPWILVDSDITLVNCHDITFGVLAIGTHWFYVESEYATGLVQTSDVYVFCTSGLFIFEQSGDDLLEIIYELVPLFGEQVVYVTMTGEWIDAGLDAGEVLPPEISTPTYELVTLFGENLNIIDSDSHFTEFGSIIVS